MKPNWLAFFETRQEEKKRDKATEDSKGLGEKSMEFLSGFKHRTTRYKLVWSIRILCWVLLCIAVIFGAAVRVAEYFK